jgi:hypothetical protein
MIRRLVSLLVGLGALVCTSAAPAQADCREVTSTTIVQGEIQTKTVRICTGGETGEGDASSSVSVPTTGTGGCLELVAGLNVDPSDFCAALPELPVVTPGSASAALRRLPLPPSTLRVQPPNGRTLVNFATNFYTDREEFTRTVRLLGQQVELRITPARFTWRFDDRESATTTTPGTPYPDLEVTHDYLVKGEVHPRVDTTYTADFRVNGGAWRPVPGSVTIEGDPVALEVVEASPILVGYGGREPRDS